MGELLNSLPIEIKGKKNQTFTFKDWGMREEKLVAKLRDSKTNMGKFISGVLRLMLKELCGEDFTSKTEGEQKLALNQMALANVMYMYLFLRHDQLGEEINLTFGCPSCDHKIKNYTANLNDLDVYCKFGDWEETINYKLKKPVNLTKGDILVETVKLGICNWDVMEKADTTGKDFNEAVMKERTFRDAIKGVEGHDGYIDMGEFIEKLKKIDIEFLNRKISEHNAGPEVQAEVSCDKCGFEFIRHLDWSYDSFFGLTSLPQN